MQFLRLKITKNKIYNYYRNHHLFLLPAANEPASISLLEAIGYSMPVICSDTCGTQFYVTKKFGKIDVLVNNAVVNKKNQ